METTNAKPAPDWEKIEADYRAGIKTLRQIAGEHGVTHGAINKRAQRSARFRPGFELEELPKGRMHLADTALPLRPA